MLRILILFLVYIALCSCQVSTNELEKILLEDCKERIDIIQNDALPQIDNLMATLQDSLNHHVEIIREYRQKDPSLNNESVLEAFEYDKAAIKRIKEDYEVIRSFILDQLVICEEQIKTIKNNGQAHTISSQRINNPR